MDSLLSMIGKGGCQTYEGLALKGGLSVEEVRTKVAEWEREGVIMGHQWVLCESKVEQGLGVRAFIEVKMTPDRCGGFDRLAERISRFDEVVSCSLFSGAYDLVVEVEGESLMEVAKFVSERLSTMSGVLSTQTSFQLKRYKKDRIRLQVSEEEGRLPVIP